MSQDLDNALLVLDEALASFIPTFAAEGSVDGIAAVGCLRNHISRTQKARNLGAGPRHALRVLSKSTPELGRVALPQTPLDSYVEMEREERLNRKVTDLGARLLAAEEKLRAITVPPPDGASQLQVEVPGGLTVEQVTPTYLRVSRTPRRRRGGGR